MEEIQNIPKLYTACAEWMSCLLMVIVYRRVPGKKKQSGSLILPFGGLIVIQMFCGQVSNALWLAGMSAAVLVMCLTLKYYVEISLNAAAYLCTRAFMRAELLASVEWQIFSYYFSETAGMKMTGITFCLIFYLIGYSIFYCIERKQLPEVPETNGMSATKEQQILVWLVMILMFSLSNLSYTKVQTPFTGRKDAEIFNIRTLVDLAGVLMLEIIHMQKMNADRTLEMVAIRNILSLQYSQFRESQANIELLNRKYHDLKHQIQVIREERNERRRDEYLNEIEKGIRLYDSEIKTGSSVLDTVLTSKSRQCAEGGITLTVVADGTLLCHLHVMDVCTIFGNALDNAIEYEAQVEDVKKRLIHVSVVKKNSMVCVVVENYYEGSLSVEKGIPETTKRDKDYHGYGLKSIRYSVNKYGGYFNMNVRDNWFRLEILFPQEKGTV